MDEKRKKFIHKLISEALWIVRDSELAEMIMMDPEMVAACRELYEVKDGTWNQLPDGVSRDIGLFLKEARDAKSS